MSAGWIFGFETFIETVIIRHTWLRQDVYNGYIEAFQQTIF